ncbi:MAG: HNH endonuclease signature motif containing protein [Pyrinomonadaceae bacterium]
MNPNYPFVSSRARHICEYCHAPEAVFNLPFEVEHIFPLSRGGDDDKSNLALSCRSCNLYKSDSISWFEEEIQIEARIFNPREDVWTVNFALDRKTGEITGLTSIGKATISRLRINSKAQLAARISWSKLGVLE